MASRVGLRVNSMRAAGPGTMETSNRCTTGFEPGTSPTTAIGIVPTAPARSRPVESIEPSKRPPAMRHVIRAFGTG